MATPIPNANESVDPTTPVEQVQSPWKNPEILCESLLNSGSFGDVYLGRDRNTSVPFAVKHISIGKFVRNTLPACRSWKETAEKIHREVEMLQSLQDSLHIVKYHSFWVEGALEKEYTELIATSTGAEENVNYELDSSNRAKVPKAVDNTFFFIRMGYCDMTLRDWMNENPNRDLDQINEIMSQILEGLKFIHNPQPNRPGIIHRDLKPNNVFINIVDNGSGADNELNVKIGDFGLARFDNFSEHSVSNAPVGCFYYRSPEMHRTQLKVVNGIKKYIFSYDFKTDIYSLGLIYFELVHRFEHGENEWPFEEIQRGKFTPLEIIDGKYHRERELIREMVQENPEMRPDATQTLEKLQKDQITYSLERLRPFDFSALQEALQGATDHPQDAFSIDVILITEEMPELLGFAEKVKADLEHWFPIISAYLQSPNFEPTRFLAIEFDPTFSEAAASSSGDHITASGKFFKKYPNDYGITVLLSTAVFSIQKYNTAPRPPVWLRDGITHYCSHYIFERGSEPSKPNEGQHFRENDDSAAYLLNYINKKHKLEGGLEIIQAANWLGREGRFNEDSFWVNATGKTIEELWQEILTNPDA